MSAPGAKGGAKDMFCFSVVYFSKQQPKEEEGKNVA
jgi:hypothetical protein